MGVTDVKTYLAADPVQTAVTTTKEIAAAIDQYVKELNKPGDEIKENLSTVWVNPHRGPFSGEPGSWWFTRGGGKPFTATIKDRGFLEGYGHGEPRLNSEDLLEVELLEKQCRFFPAAPEAPGQKGNRPHTRRPLGYWKSRLAEAEAARIEKLEKMRRERLIEQPPPERQRSVRAWQGGLPDSTRRRH
jgi:hypothetical protein